MCMVFRFEGHIVGDKLNYSSQLQVEFDKMIGYNPDVILAGNNLYDVMYHQHFFGSHKIVPLIGVGEYVKHRLQKGKIQFL